jgi:hypothetical protein
MSRDVPYISADPAQFTSARIAGKELTTIPTREGAPDVGLAR